MDESGEIWKRLGVTLASSFVLLDASGRKVFHVQQAVSKGVAAVGAGWLTVALLGLLGVVGMISLSRLFLRRRRQSDAATRAPQSSGSA